MSSELQVESLMRVAGELIDLMDAETTLLRELDIKGVGPLQPEKTRLTEIYDERVRRLAADPHALRDVEPALKEKFGELMVRFKRVAGENETALLAARDAHDTLFKAVIKAAEKQRSEGAGYDGDGAKATERKSVKGGEPLSLTLNRQL